MCFEFEYADYFWSLHLRDSWTISVFNIKCPSVTEHRYKRFELEIKQQCSYTNNQLLEGFLLTWEWLHSQENDGRF